MEMNRGKLQQEADRQHQAKMAEEAVAKHEKKVAIDHYFLRKYFRWAIRAPGRSRIGIRRNRLAMSKYSIHANKIGFVNVDLVAYKSNRIARNIFKNKK